MSSSSPSKSSAATAARARTSSTCTRKAASSSRRRTRTARVATTPASAAPSNALHGGPPPYLIVLDVGRTILLWDRWSGSFGGFNLAHRIPLATLADRPDDIALLRDVWTRPHVRDPRARAAAVTREVAARLAKLSASLEDLGYEPERVARFLMRCVFTMFA